MDFRTNQRSYIVKAINGTDTIEGLLFTKLAGYIHTASRTHLDPVRAHEPRLH